MGNIDQRINEWLNGPIDPASKQEILTLMRQNPTKLRDAFATSLSFGTGGLRSLMGIGTNRMNRYTVQMATQGLANYLLHHTSTAKTHVFISYDSRLHSKEFALDAARVLAANGIGVYLTPELRPTPFVSFGVRQKQCIAGIMITASHNPKEYNGYKVYWSDGAQVVPPHDTGIVAEVQKIERIEQVKLAPEHSPLIEIVNLELDLEYLDAIHKLQLDPKEDKQVGDQLKITYTPLHGTGLKLTPRALRSWGFTNINLVDRQATLDGNFPTVKAPNPEYAETLSLGIAQMQNTLSDILIANDPDADRIAIAVLHKGKPVILNGNQMAAICLEYICQTLTMQKRLPPKGAAITTIVSTDLIGVIAKQYKLACFEVLTGFKYIGELIHKWELENNPYQFLFGAEESYGYLIGTHSRDKDAVVMSCLFSEIALLMKVEGRTLVDFLEEIYQTYGFFLETQHTIDFPPGQEGMEKMKKMMDTLRHSHPNAIAGHPVEIVEDYQTSVKKNYKTKSEEKLHLPSSDVLLFRLADKSKIVVRPSGTEPKLKIYLAVREPLTAPLSDTKKTCEKKLATLLAAIEKIL